MVAVCGTACVDTIVLHCNYDMKFKLLVTLTWSKIMAFAILGAALFEDIFFKTDGKLLMFAIPFVAGLIGWKQYQDSKNGNTQVTNQ